MTAITEPVFGNIPLNMVRESKTNPRKTFNPTTLAELADSIKRIGVGQAILVRPHPDKDNAPECVEIVAGARRYRASKIAGCESIPAIVRDMSDVEVEEFQLVENIQRDDVNEFEEAEGIQRLMDQHAKSADDIAKMISQSRTYVFGRLKLLTLPQSVRDICAEGKVNASIALLIARIPVEELQMQAAEDVIDNHGGDEPMSYRAAAEYLRLRFMLDLSKAPFSIQDAKLVPSVGACTTCPKRTGNQPEIYADVTNKDVCTDQNCFFQKRVAHGKSIITKAHKDGIPVHEGDDGIEVFESSDHITLDDALQYFERLNDRSQSMSELGKLIPVELLPKPIAYAVIDDSPQPLFDKPAMQEALEKAGICLSVGKYKERELEKLKTEQKSEVKRISSHEDQHARKLDIANKQEKFHKTVYDQVRKTQLQGLTSTALQTIALLLIEDASYDATALIWDTYGLKDESKEERERYVRAATSDVLSLMILDAVMLPRLEVGYWEVSEKLKVDDSEELIAIAKSAGIDVEFFRAEVFPPAAPKVVKQAGKKSKDKEIAADKAVSNPKSTEKKAAKKATETEEKSEQQGQKAPAAEKVASAKPINPSAAWPFPTGTRP